MGVTLREKKISGGRVSLYLDFTFSGKRWFEFLGIHVRKNKPSDVEKTKRQLANEILIKRQHEIIVECHGLQDKQTKQADFIKFYEDFISAKKHSNSRNATLAYLKSFSKNRYVPIASITAEWMKDFEVHLLSHVSVNSALTYLKNVNAALNELVRRKVIFKNPWHEVPKHERLKKEKKLPTAWTVEQLQLLADTPCNIEPQFKQAFLFACFTGLRWSDVNRLTWGNITRKRNINNTEQWFIDFEQQKTKSPEHFPLSEQAIAILREREQEPKHDGCFLIFPKVKETDLKNKPVQSRVNNALKKWAKATGKLNFKVMKFHTSRHSFATNLLEATNGDLYTVSKLLGHKSIRMTEIYAQVRDKIKLDAVKTLPLLNMVQLNNMADIKKAA
jgi:integrase